MTKIWLHINHRVTCDRNVWPGLLLPPGWNKDSNLSVATLQEEVHSELDSQTGENFLVPMTEHIRKQGTVFQHSPGRAAPRQA